MFSAYAPLASKSAEAIVIDRRNEACRSRSRHHPWHPEGMLSEGEGSARWRSNLLSPDYETTEFSIGNVPIVLRIAAIPVDDKHAIAGEFWAGGIRGGHGAAAEGIVGRLAADLLGVEAGMVGGRAAENAVALAIAARLFRVLSVDGQPAKSRAGLTTRQLDSVVAYVETHLARPISLRAMARRSDLDSRSFVSRFRATTELTPSEYVLRKRIERAELLLAKSDLMLGDIVRGVGFRSPSSFASAFTRLVGKSPDQWRKEGRAVTTSSRVELRSVQETSLASRAATLMVAGYEFRLADIR